eukprot:10872726-Karenia_brevis.AAC.1
MKAAFKTTTIGFKITKTALGCLQCDHERNLFDRHRESFREDVFKITKKWNLHKCRKSSPWVQCNHDSPFYSQMLHILPLGWLQDD